MRTGPEAEMAEDDHAELARRALESIFGVVVKLGAAIAGITVLAMFAGWRALESYYGLLGAPWAVDLFSPSRLIAASVTPLFFGGIVATFSYVAMEKGRISLRQVTILALLALIAGTTVYSVGLMARGLLPRYLLAAVVDGGALLMLLAAGLTAGELVGRLSESKLIWRGDQVMLLGGILFSRFPWRPKAWAGLTRCGTPICLNRVCQKSR